MLGGAIRRSATGTPTTVHLTEQAAVTVANTAPTLHDHLDTTVTYDLSDKAYRYLNLTTGARGQVDPEAEEPTKLVAAVGDIVRFFWEEEVTNTDAAVEITISPNTFPGTLRYLSAPRGDKNAKQFSELLEAVA